MNQTPPANSGIHYAGWSRQTNAATNGVGIHHPQGDVMKISTYTTPLVREDNPARCNVNPVGWLQWVVQWNEGVTEGGSSGSPLFDQDHRVVGQLSGGRRPVRKQQIADWTCTAGSIIHGQEVAQIQPG